MIKINQKAVSGFIFLLLSTFGYAQEILREWDFSRQSTLRDWHSTYMWAGKNNRATQGTVDWVPDFGGSARLSVSGAPGSVDFWSELPFDLRWGDIVEVVFATSGSLEPISGFSLNIGPAKRAGHQEKLAVSVDRAGTFTVRQPIYIKHLVAGTPFGVGFSVWPGSVELYLKKIRVIRR